MTARTLTYRIQAWTLALLVTAAFGARMGHHLFEAHGWCAHEHGHEKTEGAAHGHENMHRCDFRIDGDSPHFHGGCSHDHHCDLCAYHFSLPELHAPLAPQPLAHATFWRARNAAHSAADASLAYTGDSKRRRGPPSALCRLA